MITHRALPASAGNPAHTPASLMAFFLTTNLHFGRRVSCSERERKRKREQEKNNKESKVWKTITVKDLPSTPPSGILSICLCSGESILVCLKTGCQFSLFNSHWWPEAHSRQPRTGKHRPWKGKQKVDQRTCSLSFFYLFLFSFLFPSFHLFPFLHSN